MTAQTIPFPRARKRGAKVRSGPCAPVIAFPDQGCELLAILMTMPAIRNNPENVDSWKEFATLPGYPALWDADELRCRIRRRLAELRSEVARLEALAI